MKNLPSAGPSTLATKTSSTSICPQAPGAWLGGAARELLLQLVALWHLSSEADRPFHGCRLFLQFHYCLRNVIPNFAIWCRGERPKHGIQISLERWHWPWVDWGEIRSIGKLRSLWGDFANWFWRAPWNCFNWWPSWNITNITSIGNQAEMKWNQTKYGNIYLGKQGKFVVQSFHQKLLPRNPIVVQISQLELGRSGVRSSAVARLLGATPV